MQGSEDAYAQFAQSKKIKRGTKGADDAGVHSQARTPAEGLAPSGSVNDLREEGGTSSEVPQMETGGSLTEEGGEYASDGLNLSDPHLFSSEKVMAPIQHEGASFLSPSSTELPLPPGWTEEVSTSGHT
ncbi:hypothetical protein LTS18_002698 [Coniosporium uncinatum]|uniref:Uncharacterized protein n=1 Tax=Coniosporium uncinatum TaxID=93489 RepID=A0ACC3DD75_9PEZI|nr:hypothetical protein LTS18_002698 [Coniosporium uncinatum]